jgi:hypothetical protein
LLLLSVLLLLLLLMLVLRERRRGSVRLVTLPAGGVASVFLVGLRSPLVGLDALALALVAVT